MAAPPPRWGWHRLDPRWAERLVAEAALGPRDLVIDVGAGLGALTAPLAATGAKVIAVELHAERAQQLRRQFRGRVIVVQADASDLRLPRRPFHVVANPPFAVTTTLVRRLLQPGNRLSSARLILQEQAARRWVGPKAPAARRWASTYTTRLGAPVPRHAFSPPPHTKARVLVIERRSKAPPTRMVP